MPVEPTQLDTGLSGAEAAARAQSGLDNRPPASPTKTVGRIVRENTFTFFNLVFAVLAAALIAVGSFANLGFLLVVACNTAIGIYQQLRAKKTLDALTLVAARRVRCLRGGVWQEVDSAALVLGDIVEFSAGDQICADAVVRTGSAHANESLITGEAVPVRKAVGDTLHSGSFLAAGRCVAQLTAVGAQSYASRLTMQAKTSAKTPKSEMMAALDRLIHIIGYVLVPVGVILFFKQRWYLGLPLRDATEATVAALIGMIPEGLYLLTSVALAVSVQRLGKRRVLTQDTNCIETLARVDVLCLDKTGTITAPGMDAGAPVPLCPARWPAARIAALLAELYGGSTPENDTAAALAARFAAGGVPGAGAGGPVTARVPFSAAWRYSAATLKGRGHFIIGAPDTVAGPRYTELEAAAAPLLAGGCHLLLLAQSPALPDPTAPLDHAALTFLALLPITGRLRPGAADIFAWFGRQGVAVKVISGDHPAAAAAVARRAGIPGAEKQVDAAALPEKADWTQLAEENTVFGRVTPEQKQRLVQALQAGGHTVAMTGDGVNDVLALQQADCGIAMAAGAQAASHAARLVLLDSDFAALPAVVAEGRRVINNIQRSASLFLIKNIFSFLLSVVTLAAPLAYPLEPLQLSLIGAVTIGIPSLVLALEPNGAPVRGRFLRRVFAAALPGGLTDFVLLVGVQLAALALDLERGEVSTICTAVLLAVGLCVLWGMCRPFTPVHRALWGAMLALGTAGLFALRSVLGLAALDVGGVLTLAAFAAAAPVVLRGLYRAQRRAARRFAH